MNNELDNFYAEGQLEDFRRNILNGRTSKRDLELMVESNSLSLEQIEVVEELVPAIGGLANVAKMGAQKAGQMARNAGQGLANVGRNVANKVQQAGQNVSASYQQGRQQAMQKNAVAALVKTWDASGFAKITAQLRQVFPQDPTLDTYLKNFESWVPYLTQTYIPDTYGISVPSKGAIPQPQQQSQNAQPQQGTY